VDLFPAGVTSAASGTGQILVTSLPSTPAEAPWRDGLFHPAEPDSMWQTGTTMCWTGGPVSFHLPGAGGERLRMPYRTGAVDEQVRFMVGDETLATAEPSTTGEIDVTLPGPDGADVTLTVETGTWSPSDAGESEDTRELGILLRSLTIGEPGDQSPEVAGVTAVGDGWVVEATAGGPDGMAAALGELLRNGEAHGIEPFRPELAAGSHRDDLYLTLTTTDVLLYNHGDDPVMVNLPQGAVEVPGHTILSVETREE
jgi:hypothetical protein